MILHDATLSNPRITELARYMTRVWLGVALPTHVRSLLARVWLGTLLSNHVHPRMIRAPHPNSEFTTSDPV
jgi:hypothetical protein